MFELDGCNNRSSVAYLPFCKLIFQGFGHAGLPDQITIWIVQISENRLIILLLVNAVLIFPGMLLDDVCGTLVAAPLLMPLMLHIGVSPVHFAAILATNLGLGCVTPPVAPSLFVGAHVAGLPITVFIKYVVILLVFANLPVLLLTTYFPDFSLSLPRLIMGDY